MDEKELVKRAKYGDVQAFGALYEKVYRKMYQYALYTLKNEQDAEDVVSETVTDAFASIKKLRSEEAFSGWIFRILSNKCKQKVYRSSYENGQEMTEFTKFSYKDGQMYPVADNMVKGDITDTFAISQHGDMLRVLTTDWSGPTVQNRLYILDANLNVLGEIEHIADGESIYAARYVENTAYFITYRNTDPLFVADLTDCESPTLLGCVEVSGFSEYLHMYGEGLVLGIGYETDENSRYEGLKLCMFDVSDPLQPVASDSYVMPEVSRTTALYDYKAILVDAKKNLIGFVTESWNDGFTCVYELFSWNGAAFQEIMSVPLCENGDYNWYMEETRGLYAGNYFYVVADDGIVSFDMENGFAEVDRVTFIK